MTCGTAPLSTGRVPLFCAFRDGTAFGGDRALLEIFLFFLYALALVRTVGIRRMRKVFVIVRKVVEEECRRMIRQGDRSDKGRVADDLRDLRGRREVTVA